MAGATLNCCHLGAFCVHHTTMHNITSLHAKSHTSATCTFARKWPGVVFCFFCFFIHFFWCTTAVKRGWNGYRNKSQRRRLTLENKKNLPPLLPGLQPEIFGSRIRSSNHWAIATPRCGSDVPGHTFFSFLFLLSFSSLVLTVQLWRRSEILAHCLSKFLQSKNVI